jgi:phosphoribosyl 1,2-cyclic phosphate phosphodiesterase
LKALILGCGTSSGVPRVGPDWGDCDPAEPRNRRRRASVLIQTQRTRILVDTSPDLREQLIDVEIADVDAVIWTHDHADHCHGIDDLRQLYHARGRPVDGYARVDTLATLRARFAYAFDGRDGYPPVVRGHMLTDAITIGDVRVRVVDQPHGSVTSAGLRFEHAGRAIGYATDFHAVTPEMETLFAGLDLWIVDALRRKPHPTHPHLALTLDAIDRLKPKRAVLTHMDQSMDYAGLLAELPDGIVPGHDGMEI